MANCSGVRTTSAPSGNVARRVDSSSSIPAVTPVAPGLGLRWSPAAACAPVSGIMASLGGFFLPVGGARELARGIIALAKTHHLHHFSDDAAHDEQTDAADPEQRPVLDRHGESAHDEGQEHDDHGGPGCWCVAVTVVGHRASAPFGIDG